jgi:hypothetical protein
MCHYLKNLKYLMSLSYLMCHYLKNLKYLMSQKYLNLHHYLHKNQ